MGMANTLTLIANPGSASRKYALYEGEHERATLHFEWQQGQIVCTLRHSGTSQTVPLQLTDLREAVSQVNTLLLDNQILQEHKTIQHVGLRIVAPSAYFLEDRVIDQDFVTRLEAVKPRAPIHIAATLEELRALRSQFSGVPIFGVSDSAFHITKPDYAWNYGISLEDADQFDIKRFGYHGLSVASVVRQLEAHGKLPPKLVVCHLGSGASVTAVFTGKSVDTTMGYSPLEGVVMSTRSGSLDFTAARALKDTHNFDDAALENYLNNHAGLLGLGGSSDLRELLHREAHGDNRSRLAIATYIYSVQKAIGQMTAAIGGADVLVFTGTIGERSAPVRERIVKALHYLDFILDDNTNYACDGPEKPYVMSQLAYSKPVLVVPAQEAAEIIHRIRHIA